MADGHLTTEPNETVYSGVISLRNLRVAIVLAEIYGLQLWGADFGNAYRQALTKENLYIVVGPEFEGSQVHVLVMHKASMVHVGTTNSLIFSTKWISNLPKQTQRNG